jgi:hypothetical protein
MSGSNDTEVALGRGIDRPPALVQGSYLTTKSAEARAAGASWDDIHAAVNAKWDQARAAGASDADIEKVLGFQNPQPIDDRIRDHVASALNSVAPPTQVDGVWGGFRAGAEASVTGLLAGGLPHEELVPGAGFMARTASALGQGAGDLPAMVPGIIARSPTTAMALPTAIKSVVTDAYENGMYKSPGDAASRIANIAWETVKSAAEGKAMGLAGGVAAARLSKFGDVASAAGAVGGSTAGLTAAQAALEGHLPTPQNLLDNAMQVGLFHAGSMGVERAPTIMRNMMDRWTATNDTPAQTAQEAATDPHLYGQLMLPPEGAPAPGSSMTPTGEAGESLVVSRPHGAFDDAVGDPLKTSEPGMRYGISAKNNPDIDLSSLTPDSAANILHEKYWGPLGLDDAPPAIAKEVLGVAARDGIEAGQKVLDLFTAAPEAPAEGEKPSTALALLTEQVGPEVAKAMPNTVALLDRRGVGGEPPKPPAIPERPAGSAEGPEGGPTLWGDPWAKAREAMAEGTTERVPTETTGQALYRELFNRNAPVLRLWRAIRGGEPIRADDNALLTLRDEEGSGSRAQWRIHNKLAPILKTVAPDEWHDFGTYLAAYRAHAEHVNGVENPMDKAAARQVLDQASMKYGTKFSDALEKLRSYRMDLMTYMQDRGMLSAADVDLFTKEAAYGVPGWRESDLARVRAPGSQVFNPVRKVANGQEKFIHPVEALMRDTFTRMALADRNATNLALMRKAVPAGEATVRNVETKPAEMQEVQPNKTGTPSEQEAWMTGIPTFEMGSEEALVKMFGGTVKPDEVPVFDQGVRKLVVFKDPEVARVLRQYDENGMGRIMEIAAKATSAYRWPIVHNPLFAPVITGGDQLFFQMFKPGGMVGRNSAPANLVEGLFHSLLPTGMWQRAVEAGVVQHAFASMSRDDLVRSVVMNEVGTRSMPQRVWNRVTSPLEWWTTHIMNAPSVGRYARGLRNEEPELEARAAATEAVFHRPGYGGAVSRQINRSMIPFTTAFLNGLEKEKRMFLGGEGETGEKMNPATAWLKLAAVVTVPVLGSYFAYHDKEWYKALHPSDKDNYFILRTGGDGPAGITHKFWIPPGIAFVGSALPRRIAEQLYGHDPDAWQGMAEAFGRSFAPTGSESGFAPSVLGPMLEAINNHSMVTGRPLVSDADQRLLPSSRYKPYTTQTAKTIASFVNNTLLAKTGTLAPEDVDTLISGYTGKMGMGMLQTVERLLGAPPAPGENSFWKSSFFTATQARYPTASSQPTEDFYGQMDTYNQVHNTLIQKMKEGDLAGFKSILTQYPWMATMHRWSLSNEDRMQMGAVTPAYTQALDDAVDKEGPAERQAALGVLKASKLLQVQSTYARMVERNANGALKPVEQSQILDQAYMGMQAISERGLAYFHQAGQR